MIADPEDLLMLLVSVAPLVVLCVLLVGSRTKTRIVLFLVSLLLFFFFLPYTSLYLGLPLITLIPWLESPAVGNAAPVVLTVTSILLMVFLGVLATQARRTKKTETNTTQ